MTSVVVPALLVCKVAEPARVFLLVADASHQSGRGTNRLRRQRQWDGHGRHSDSLPRSGPKFLVLLPISSVPMPGQTIGVASNIAFQRLQQATNPHTR